MKNSAFNFWPEANNRLQISWLDLSKSAKAKSEPMFEENLSTTPPPYMWDRIAAALDAQQLDNGIKMQFKSTSTAIGKITLIGIAFTSIILFLIMWRML